MGTSGTSRVASGKSSLLSSCEGERGIALGHCKGIGPHLAFSEGESAWCFSSCGKNIRGSSRGCDGDFREPLMVPQEVRPPFQL